MEIHGKYVLYRSNDDDVLNFLDWSDDIDDILDNWEDDENLYIEDVYDFSGFARIKDWRMKYRHYIHNWQKEGF